jgi:hypothetical protein
MTLRYSIVVRMPGAAHMTELCQVSNNPEAVAAGAKAKTSLVDNGSGRMAIVPRYEHVAIIDHEAPKE